MRLFVLVVGVLSCIFVVAQKSVTIEWIDSTRHFVTEGSYARIKKMNNGNYLLVYEHSGNVCCRISTDRAQTWGHEILVAHHDGYQNTNSEAIQLADGKILYAWNGRQSGRSDLPYVIKTKTSSDFGQTWANEKLVYAGDTIWGNGVWEPVMLQLPSGEVQLYFSNESPYRQSNEQEITMLRSQDGGETWYDTVRTSFRPHWRDGMMVPMLLQNKKGIVYAIEDLTAFNFHPAIIYTSLDDNWKSGTVMPGSSKRWWALKKRAGAFVYQGAPYLAQFPSGETILSIQSSQGMLNFKGRSKMQVFIGDDEAKHFTNKTKPFSNLPSKATAMWNSVTVQSDDEVIAVSSVAGVSECGVWTVLGKKKTK